MIEIYNMNVNRLPNKEVSIINQSLINVSKFSVETPSDLNALFFYRSNYFFITPAIFSLAYFNTSFIFYVIGCSCPKYC